MQSIHTIKKGSRETWSNVKQLINSFIFSMLLVIAIQPALQAQDTVYTRPSWYFGVAGAANINFFQGSTQQLNADFMAPTPFQRGVGVGLYIAPLIEFRPANSVLGVMLQAGYDSKRGKYKQVINPCNCPADLSTELSYFVIEPSLRIAPFKNGFYLYMGPRMAFNLHRDFTYSQGVNPQYPSQALQPDVTGQFSHIDKTLISGQVGMGYDIQVSSIKSRTQFVISPFAAFQPYFGQSPRTIETWNITSLRAGIALKIGRGHKHAATPPMNPVAVFQDRDGDGISDRDDRCPDTKGPVSLQGCPDRDGDGVADIDDRCADSKGLISLQGCPDRDGDGIADIDDKCPDVSGLTRYQGCPIPDTDGDGVNDEEDKCVTIKGPVSNYGCPVISDEVKHAVDIDAKNIYFVTASAELLPKSYISLKDVVARLKENPAYRVQIDGHTDAIGNDEYNQHLSDQRSASVKTYLVSNGISESRISSKGYGESRPIEDNQTAVGRSRNRRVEMTLSVY